MAPEQVAGHQRARLQGAMVEAVARHGFAGTTLRELVGIAGVSKSTFYEHFDSKQECFLATFEEVVRQAGERVSAAYRRPGDTRSKLIAALDVFMQTALEEPAAASLVAVESLTLGTAGVAVRERGWSTFERLIAQSFEASPSKVEVSPQTVRAIVGGIRGVLYRRLRDGRTELLRGYVEELVDWGLGYQRRDSAAVGQARRAAGREPRRVAGAEVQELSWSEPPDSRRARAALTQRQRIARAAARLVAQDGFEALSIPAISGEAGVSNQTFYEHFPSKREAFLEAFENRSQRAFESALAALRAAGEGPEAIGIGIGALLDHIATDELFARIAFFELPSAGPAALNRADATIDAFTAVLRTSLASGRGREAPSEEILVAIGSGVWAVIQHELARGGPAAVPALGPEIARIAVAPFG